MAPRKKISTKAEAKPASQAELNGRIDQATVKRVIGMRKKGTGWPEILEKLGQPRSFIGKVRPLMKAVDPKSVLPLGPGSPKYGKAKAKAKSKA